MAFKNKKGLIEQAKDHTDFLNATTEYLSRIYSHFSKPVLITVSKCISNVQSLGSKTHFC